MGRDANVMTCVGKGSVFKYGPDKLLYRCPSLATGVSSLTRIVSTAPAVSSSPSVTLTPNAKSVVSSLVPAVGFTTGSVHGYSAGDAPTAGCCGSAPQAVTISAARTAG